MSLVNHRIPNNSSLGLSYMIEHVIIYFFIFLGQSTPLRGVIFLLFASDLKIMRQVTCVQLRIQKERRIKEKNNDATIQLP
jgi:hypothetical protein